MAENNNQAIVIIVPSFNDQRILRAIESVRMFDDCGIVSLHIQDGGSNHQLLREIEDKLSRSDRLVVERDLGIFDALNKALDSIAELEGDPIVGWLGSDDVYTGWVDASEVAARLSTNKIFVSDTLHVKFGRVIRRSYSWPVRAGLVPFGLNNPHFSTFLRYSVIGKRRFDTESRSSDVQFFCSLLTEPHHLDSVAISSAICTVMELGGYSSSGIANTLRANHELFTYYSRFHQSRPLGCVCVIFRLALKLVYSIPYRLKIVKVGAFKND